MRVIKREMNQCGQESDTGNRRRSSGREFVKAPSLTEGIINKKGGKLQQESFVVQKMPQAYMVLPKDTTVALHYSFLKIQKSPGLNEVIIRVLEHGLFFIPSPCLKSATDSSEEIDTFLTRSKFCNNKSKVDVYLSSYFLFIASLV